MSSLAHWVRTKGADLLLPLARKFPVESVTPLTGFCLQIVSKTIWNYSKYQDAVIPKPLGTTIKGVNFRSRVGIAAGLDKNAEFVDGLGVLDPGFIEIGSVLEEPYGGNERPRMWRLAEELSLVNNLGLPSHGIDSIEENIAYRRWKGRLGVNIAKHPQMSQTNGIISMLRCADTLAKLCDYLVFNISCPNTKDSSKVSSASFRKELLEGIAEKRKDWKEKKSCPLILLKVAPGNASNDFLWLENDLKLLLDDIDSYQLDGLIVCNTLKDQELLSLVPSSTPTMHGGMSGAILNEVSKRLLEQFTAAINARRYFSPENRPMIISSGGIMTPKQAKERIDAGADLVQVYSGLIFTGTKLLRAVNKI